MELSIYYGGKKTHFGIPSGWNVLYGQEVEPAKPCTNPLAEVIKALDHPIGSPRLEELASRANRAVVIFDDLTRPTPTSTAFPEILNRLNRGGVPDARITAICATGTHQPPDEAGLKEKLGLECFGRLYPKVVNHNATSKDNILVGRTSKGTPVIINPHVYEADLIVGMGACFPHSWAGFGGGSKIVMPGICGFQSIAAHHLTWIRNLHTRSGVTQGNLFYEEANEIARIIGFNFKMDFLLNFKGEVTGVFCGDVVQEHAEAIKECIRTIAVDLPRKADLTISAAYPLERGNQSIKSLSTAASVTKPGGQIIWVAPQPDRDQLIPFVNEVGSEKTANEFHQQLLEGNFPEALKPIGLSFMCTVMEVKSYLECFTRIIHVTHGLDRSHVEAMKMAFAKNIEEAIDIAKADLPKGDVAVFPFGGIVLARIASY
jgi:nickel-dependent lactate racemase